MTIERTPHQRNQATPGLPGLARSLAEAWARTSWRGVVLSTRVGERLARAAVNPLSALTLAGELRDGLRSYARAFLGVEDLEGRLDHLSTPPGTFSMRGRRNGHPADPDELQRQGAELLRRTADGGAANGIHPAFGQLLGELTGDEARILRLLAADGPQPMLDVRATSLIGSGTQLVAPSLNLLGSEASLVDPERVLAYLGNLHRLGLVWFSPQAVADERRYAKLEDQREVVQALREAGRAKTVHKSLRLTPFGADFCECCLPAVVPAVSPPGPS